VSYTNEVRKMEGTEEYIARMRSALEDVIQRDIARAVSAERMRCARNCYLQAGYLQCLIDNYGDAVSKGKQETYNFMALNHIRDADPRLAEIVAWFDRGLIHGGK
jgi:hypothetical protein